MSQKRKTYSAQFKFETVMEALQGQKSKAEICRERDIKESLLYKWKQEFVEQGPRLFEDKRGRQTNDEAKDRRIAELERMVGRLAMEVDILKKAETWLKSNRKPSGR